MSNLFQRSIQVILTNQAANGAYIASPNFPSYRYCWFRDGAFIAYAMDLVGEHDSALRFHDWAVHVILRHADKAWRAIGKAARGEPLGEDYLHTRYTEHGEEGLQEWPNFQLDGFGTWLWGLEEHLRHSGARNLPSEWENAARLASSYLVALWRCPCNDCWEEYPNKVHISTLAALYGGLRSAAKVIEDDALLGASDEIRARVLQEGVSDGHLVKYMGSDAVDASLLGASMPYRLLHPAEPLMSKTVSRIETDLHRPGGGVYRYRGDTYYGAGEWTLLAAWLGWYYVETGEHERARALLAWVAAQSDERGHLPEQVTGHLLAPGRYAYWTNRWGPIATPLLWSHAMYLILASALGDA